MSDIDEVYLFWDFDNLPVHTPDIFTLAAEIILSLKTEDGKLHLARPKYVAGNFNWLDYKDRRRLEKYGYILEQTIGYQMHCAYDNCKSRVHSSTIRPDRYARVKEVADRMIVQRLQQHVLQNTKPKKIILITGDKDFEIPMKFLKQNGYHVFLAIEDDTEMWFEGASHKAWKWSHCETKKAYYFGLVITGDF